jgi:membrane protein DedA with SNARE-associated domain
LWVARKGSRPRPCVWRFSMSDYLPQINAWLDMVFAHGSVWVYLAILTACVIENFFPPFPGDTFVVIGGSLVALGRLDPACTLVVACVGGMLSAVTLYAFGRHFGRGFFIRKNYHFFSADHIARAEMKFEKWGDLIMITSRFAVGLRVALLVGAGIVVYPAWRMIVYTLVSYLLYSSLLMLLGYKLVENFDKIETFLATYNYIAWVIVVALVAWYLFRRAKKARRGEQK